MFIRLNRSESCGIISLHGRQLDIIKLPDATPADAVNFTMAIVVIHEPQDVNLGMFATEHDWDKFTVLVKCETDTVMGHFPLMPVLDQICNEIKTNAKLFDLEDLDVGTTFINHEKAQDIYDKIPEHHKI